MIVTKRTNIISLERKYLEQLRKIRNLPEVRRLLSNVWIIGEEEQFRWFNNQALDERKKYFAVLKDKKLIGIIWLDEWDKINASCRIGLFLSPENRGQGIGEEIMRGFLNYLFDDLNLHRVWLFVLDDNEPAFNLYKKLGFKKEGKQREAIFRGGKYHDYLMMSLLKDER